MKGIVKIKVWMVTILCISSTASAGILTFEGGETGTTYSEGAMTATIVDDGTGTNNVLSIARTSGWTQSFASLELPGSIPGTGSFTVEMDLKFNHMTWADTDIIIGLSDQPADLIPSTVSAYGPTIYLSDPVNKGTPADNHPGTLWVSEGGVQSEVLATNLYDTWFHLKLVLDQDADTYDLYVDDVLLANVAYNAASGTLRSLALRGDRSSVFFDNVYTSVGAASQPPVFTIDPINKPDGVFGVAYTGQTLAGSATDPDGDPITYSVSDGPSWLGVDVDGVTLIGTPSFIGTNTFTILAEDGTGAEASATLYIYVPNPGLTETVYSGIGSLTTSENWSFGLPGEFVTDGIITNDSDGLLNGEISSWAGGNVVISNGATITVEDDFRGMGASTITVYNATINNTGDDFQCNSPTVLILEEGSVVNSKDTFYPNAFATMIINGGTHISEGDGAGTDHWAGASADGTFEMYGGSLTAESYQFRIRSMNTIGGTAVLDSEDSTATLSVDGTINILSDWTGSWTVGSFTNGTEWAGLVTAGFQLDGVAIDAPTFTAEFSVINGGTTLQLGVEPPVAIGDASIITLPSGDVEVSWMSALAHTYAVESKTNLILGSWTPYTNGIAGTDGTITVTVDNAEPNAFYQVTGQRD